MILFELTFDVMKSILLPLFLMFLVMTARGQIGDEQSNVVQNNNSEINSIIYRLFPTQNIRIFIKLNTRNGQMWLIQFDVEDDNRLETYLNLLPLVAENKEVNNRFTLYSTQNFWTFILLDQIDGRTWQVQWSFEPENRFVIPIN